MSRASPSRAARRRSRGAALLEQVVVLGLALLGLIGFSRFGTELHALVRADGDGLYVVDTASTFGLRTLDNVEVPGLRLRDETEFKYGGQAGIAYPADPDALTDAEWVAYLFWRDNPKGPWRERWRINPPSCWRTNPPGIST